MPQTRQEKDINNNIPIFTRTNHTNPHHPNVSSSPKMNKPSSHAMASARTKTSPPKTMEGGLTARDYPQRTYVDGPPNPMRRQRAYLDLDNLWACEKAKHHEQVNESKDKIVNNVNAKSSTKKHETVKPPTQKAKTVKSPTKKAETVKPPTMKKSETIKSPSMKAETVKPSIEKIERVKSATEKVDNFKPRAMRPENIMPPAKEIDDGNRIKQRIKKAECVELGGHRWRFVGDEFMGSVLNEKQCQEGLVVKGVMGGGRDDEWMLLHSIDEKTEGTAADDADWEKV